MNILYVNNYWADKKSFLSCKAGEKSLAHLWGVDILINKENVNLCFENSEYITKYRLRFVRFLLKVIFQIRLYIRYRKFDCIYAASAYNIDIFAFLSSFSLFKGKINVIIHHPCKIFFSRRYNSIVCFSQYTFNLLKAKYKLINIYYKFWGPYLPFYEKVLEKTDYDSQYCDFYSNGKSCRDISLLIKAFQHEHDVNAIILGTNVINKNIQGIHNVSQQENLAILRNCKVVLVPVIKNNWGGVCGLTSINDALGAGKPVLISDSCNIGFDVQEVGIGLQYRAGDLEDFIKKMKQILEPVNYEKYSTSIKDFVDKNNYVHFRNFIKNLILE